jgi:hypothetical protein
MLRCVKAGTRIAVGAVMSALAAGAASAQADRDILDRVERLSQDLDIRYRLTVPPDQPIFERLLLDHRASLRFGLLAVDNELGSTRILRQSDAQLQVLAQLDGAHTLYGRLRFLYHDFNSGDSFDGRGDEFEPPIGDRYWYQYDDRSRRIAETGVAGEGNIRVKVGRDYFQWGAGLALNNVLYHGLLDLELGPLGLRGLVGLTPATQTVDFDASRPGFDDATRRQYLGVELEWRGDPRHRPSIAYLVQRDRGHRNFALIPTALNDAPTSFSYDSEYLSFGAHGSLGAQWAYRVEAVHETGRSRSSPIDPATAMQVAQTDDRIEAWAGLATLSYLFRDEHDSRLSFEVMAGTGDDDRLEANDTFLGNAPGTRDNAFNGLGYVNTGLALAPEITNLLAFRVGASTSPRPRGQQYDWLRVGVDGFVFTKIDQGAPLSVATQAESFVGSEVDLYADWQIFSDVVASVRYGVFFPGEAMPDGQDDPRHFLYTGVTIDF